MSTAERLRVNNPHVVHETIDGEAILINLLTGSYYSTRETGAFIWDLAQKGVPVSQIAAALPTRFSGVPVESEQSVREFVNQFVQEGLLVPDEAADTVTAVASTAPQDGILAYSKPELSKYTEIEDLLLLDPIHDVDDSGWPHRLPDAP